MKFLMFILAFTFISSSHAEDIDDSDYSKDSAEYNLITANKYFELATIGADARIDKELNCTEGTYVSEIVDATLMALTKSSYVDDASYQKMYNNVIAEKNLASIVGQNFSLKSYHLARLNYATGGIKSDSDIVAEAIVGTTLWGPGVGAYGSQRSVEFINATEAKVGTMEVLDNTPWTKWTYKTVNYSVTTGKDKYGYDTTVIVIDNKRFVIKESYDYVNSGETQFFPEDEQEGEFVVPAYIEYASECEA